MMDINEALAALDVANDEQWTTDGLPKVDVVAGLVGNDKLKRADILEASPDFNRDVAKAVCVGDVVLKDAGGKVIGPNDEVASPTPKENDGVVYDEGQGPEAKNYGKDAEVVTDVETRDETNAKKPEASEEVEVPKPQTLEEQLQAAFNEANIEINEVSRQFSTLNERRKELELQIGYLGGQLDKVKKINGSEQNAIRQYLETQHRVKQEKAAARQALLDSGLAEVLKSVGPVALDAAMRQRKPLPSNVRRQYPRAINPD